LIPLFPITGSEKVEFCCVHLRNRKQPAKQLAGVDRKAVMQNCLRIVFAALLLLFTAGLANAAEQVRIASLKAGTLNWELDVIQHHGLDKKYGIEIVNVPVAGKQGADIMLLGGEADVIVTDWLWVSRQRAQGRDFTFIPYSRQVGGIVVPRDSPIASIADLRGKKIGIGGGPTDKSWVLLKVYAKAKFGLDLTKDAEPVFAAPPLINEKIEAGELDAAINFWHLAAKLKAKGMREIVSVAAAAQELGLDPSVPLLGYVFSEGWAKAHPGAIAGLAKASMEAKMLLKNSDPEWQRLRALIAPKDDAQLTALRDGFRAGIPDTPAVDEFAAARLFAALAEFGGKELAGEKAELSPGTFMKLE
jgi:NitT/TauT family transport system substrate-binding protein